MANEKTEKTYRGINCKRVGLSWYAVGDTVDQHGDVVEDTHLGLTWAAARSKINACFTAAIALL
jgi:hypothetical protein